MTRLPYDVVVVGGLKPLILTQAERGAVRNALKKSPSDAVVKGYAIVLASYIAHSEEAEKLSPRKVGARLKKLLDCGRELATAIEELRTSDRCYIGRFWTRKFLADEACTSEAELLNALGSFVDDVQRTYSEVRTMERKGAMPAYSAQSLAREISYLLYLDAKQFPPLTRGGVFDRLLRCALDAGNTRLGRDRRSRSDVMALMVFAKANFERDAAEQFQRVVSG